MGFEPYTVQILNLPPPTDWATRPFLYSRRDSNPHAPSGALRFERSASTNSATRAWFKAEGVGTIPNPFKLGPTG